MSRGTISFVESFLGIIVSTIVPVYVGLFATSLFRKAAASYLAAFSFGVFFWYLSDTISDSAYLDVNAGFSGGLIHASLFSLAVLGFLAFAFVDRNSLVGATSEGGSRRLFTVPILVGIGLSFHAFGEGAGFGVLAASTSSTSLVDAVGGYGPGASYVLHKVLEGSVIGTSYWIYMRDAGLRESFRRMVMLGLIFGIPTFMGEAVAYFYQFDATYFFAIATGSSIYVALRLAKPLFGPGTLTSLEAIRVVVLITAGFTSIYLAALLHSTSL
ncbi:MAG: hypothetical protein LYZ66_03635 [Nitrososphaerales archaeon]|nr:hypothetical protein [Nitrososphaerales archaeon]